MGSYDEVEVPCGCGAVLLFQSKGGDCSFKRYTLADAPMDVMSDVNRHAPYRCGVCGRENWVAVGNAASGAEGISRLLGLPEESLAALRRPTPSGFDPLWVIAINGVLEDRGSDLRITDIDNELWERFLGPMVDYLQGMHDE